MYPQESKGRLISMVKAPLKAPPLKHYAQCQPCSRKSFKLEWGQKYTSKIIKITF